MEPCQLRQVPGPGVLPEPAHNLLMLLRRNDSPLLTVGREISSSDVALTSNVVPLLVSRKHAHITFCRQTGVLSIRDESVNGTFVNWQRLPRGVEKSLREGDIISLGGGVRVCHAEQVALSPPPQWPLVSDPSDSLRMLC